MKKADFIQVVAEKAGLSKKDTVKVVDSALEAIKELLVKGDDISFIGFGSFGIAERAAREGKVPGTNRTYKEKIIFLLQAPSSGLFSFKFIQS